MGPTFIPFPDGRYLLADDDPELDRDEVAKFSSKDADRLGDCHAWIAGVADVLGPLLLTTPPSSARAGPRTCSTSSAWRGACAASTCAARRRHPPVHDEHQRPARPMVRVRPRSRAVLAINGIIGTWAGPEEPGTAYVMMHHSIGDVGDGHLGSWGYPIGGMGAVSDAIRSLGRSRSAPRSAPTPRSSASCTKDGKVVGVALGDGTELVADIVVAATHPQITFLRQIDRRELPDDFVADLEHWQSRSGTVKVNLALSELPDFAAWPGHAGQGAATAARSSSATRSTTSSRRSATPARAGRRPARSPTAASRRPSTARSAPRARTSCRCSPSGCRSTWSDEPHHRRARGLRRPGHRRLQRARPELQAVDHPPPGDRAATRWSTTTA